MILTIRVAFSALCLVVVAGCGAPAPSEQTTAPPDETAASPSEAHIDDFTIEDVAPREVEALLSGRVLEQFRALPVDYQNALAAYLAFGVAPELIPELVEQKMAKWPEEPEPLTRLLGPEVYARFEALIEQPGSNAIVYAELLLGAYVYGHAVDPTFESRSRAVRDSLEAFLPSDDEPEGLALLFTQGAPTPGETEANGEANPVAEEPEEVYRPPLESLLVPLARDKIDLLGPNFQRALRQLVEWGRGAVEVSSIEVFLLKIFERLELPEIEASLSEKHIAEWRALPASIRDELVPIYFDLLATGVTGTAIYQGGPEMPPSDFARSVADSQVKMGKLRYSIRSGKTSSGVE